MKQEHEIERLVFAAIADDDTGASDLAGMLAEQQVRTLLVIDLPGQEQFLEWSRECDAVVMAEGTRNLSVDSAREKTRQALQIVTAKNPRVTAIKYCSTFDSTPAGNIGPTIDAALDELGEDFTIALPSLPVNGRTTRQGVHYVDGQPLSESPMRYHPLNPMTNSNLVEWLQLQTRRKVGLAALPEVEAGVASLSRCYQDLQESGVAVAIIDCMNDERLETICRASADLRLITGSSAFGMKLPAIWRERGWLQARVDPAPMTAPGRRPPCDHGCLIIAGSCSEATRKQNVWFAAGGGRAFRLDPRDLLNSGEHLSFIRAQICGELGAGRNCLCYTSDEPEKVKEIQEWGAGGGLSVTALGEMIATAMANLTKDILQNQPVAGLIIAGGETSSAICRRLELGALRVGRNIEPGVPLCHSLTGFTIPVVPKSGNFGSEDFYGRALRAVMRADELII
jgi:3-dehydrotetronate 4-kinase